MFVLGSASRAKLVGVHPDLVRVVERAIQITPVDFRVICGLRTVSQQRVLVATGKSRTMRSRHLTGHAVDLVPLPVDWDKTAPFVSMASAMKVAGKECGVPVEWGGDWAGFVDMPHFQLPHRKYP